MGPGFLRGSLLCLIGVLGICLNRNAGPQTHGDKQGGHSDQHWAIYHLLERPLRPRRRGAEIYWSCLVSPVERAFRTDLKGD